MRAFKFLRPRAVGPFSGFRWPLPENGAPGAWVSAPTPLRPGLNGVHACRTTDLPYWLTEELWHVDLGGTIVQKEKVVVAERGRLVSRVEAWTEETAIEFALACVTRAFEQAAAHPQVEGYAQDAQEFALGAREGRSDLVAVVAYTAAHTSDYAGERRWQAAWLEQTLGL